ncbi:hypothetical protein L6452_05233 [Arctium lappa]|uniref:Uncharacterized protein n=1 Tax=Arctium lappa TaxID=4217 RepID=A0ACB9EG49_ARCLA|nr:hypothetical protein L6452_05233 [Arctium lappa]
MCNDEKNKGWDAGDGVLVRVKVRKSTMELLCVSSNINTYNSPSLLSLSIYTYKYLYIILLSLLYTQTHSS